MNGHGKRPQLLENPWKTTKICMKIQESSKQINTIMWSFAESPKAWGVSVINIKREK